MEPSLDVVGVGNSIVDVIAMVDDDFIEKHGLAKGAMTLIDEERATSLYAVMPPALEISGGSAANTVAGVASFGGSAAYIGKVRNDQLGEVFAHDLRAAGVGFDVSLASSGPPTGRSLIQVTPDAERTMNTFLGTSTLLAPADIDGELVASAAITYCEGYLWDVDVAKAAIRSAMDAASEAGRLVSLTLSDSFCVDRHRHEWLDLISDTVDLVFANETEICSLFEIDDFDAAAAQAAEITEVVALTRSARGSVVVSGNERVEVPAVDVAEIVDATGAGDLYASGFLFGLATGAGLQRCAELGSIAAAEIISHVGARPRARLGSLGG
ncbi:MAG: adenosine kinase [Acidimicrobiaceae bacterium]|nr:adenosine kinase [Acidimicrobiaceae bacterium]MDE0607737.1 adenosine kinase [Acidimicrobiaceae bacterium]